MAGGPVAGCLPDGREALHEPLRRGQEAVLVGDHPQTGEGRQQFPGLEQKFRPRRPAHGPVAAREGFVQQNAAGRDAGRDGGQQWAPEVVGHHYGVEAAPGEGPGALLDVRMDEFSQRRQGSDRLGGSVHAGHGMAVRMEPAQVPAAAAGHVQHMAARRHQVGPARDPSGWRVLAVHRGMGWRTWVVHRGSGVGGGAGGRGAAGVQKQDQTWSAIITTKPGSA